jgi:hypothetical protein
MNGSECLGCGTNCQTPCIQFQGIKQELAAANIEIARLQRQSLKDSWANNPDRMGGCFSQDEIERSRNGGW